MPTRREVLAWLGAAVGAAGCSERRIFSREVPGALLGANHRLGHRLRDARFERVAHQEPIRVRVLVFGAGASGLSAAWRLERLGERSFIALDLESFPGGTATYGSDGVVPYPWGAHYVPVPGVENLALIALLDELGALAPSAPGAAPQGRERWLVRQPEERLFIDGVWQRGLFPLRGATPEDLAQLGRFEAEVARWAAFRDGRGRPAFALPMRRCSDDAEVTALDRESAARFLDARGLVSSRLRWYLEYACRDDYGCTLEETSAWALLFYFASRARLKVDGTLGGSAPFLAWPEGNGRLVAHLGAVVGDRLRLGRLVTEIVPTDTGVEAVAYRAEDGRLERYRADYAICALPRFVLPHVVRPFRARAPAYVSAFSYSAWAVSNVHLRARPSSKGYPTCWDNVLYGSQALGYVPATHQALRDRGATVWTYYQPMTQDAPERAREKLLQVDRAEFVEAILSELGPAHHGFQDAVERIDTWRWGHAMVRPTPGFIWGPHRRAAATPWGRLFFAHSDLSGLALFEEAQDRGVQAAEGVLRALGRSFEGWTG